MALTVLRVPLPVLQTPIDSDLRARLQVSETGQRVWARKTALASWSPWIPWPIWPARGQPTHAHPDPTRPVRVQAAGRRISKVSGGGVAHTETQETNSEGTYTSGQLPLGSDPDGDAQYEVKVISPSPSLFAPDDPGHLLGTPPGILDTTLTFSDPGQTDIDFTKVG